MTFLSRSKWLITVAIAILMGCRELYVPAIPETATDFLVVDGFINPQGSSVFRLTRTTSLATPGARPTESRATAVIQDDTGTRYPLTESPAGTYTATAQALPSTRQYQLRITTAKGKDYQSDLVPVKSTPPIDNLTWKLEGNNVNVYVDTHDATSKSIYYRWSYEDTWLFSMDYRSKLRYSTGRQKFFKRVYDDSLYMCWRSANSTDIRQTNTQALSQDKVSAFPLIALPKNSARLRYGYSTLVRQYAQTLEEYNYWGKLRKNTENIGTLTDAQPTQLTGNVHCLSNANEPVLGFVAAHSVTEKRLLIMRADLPNPVTWFFKTGNEDCLPVDKLDFNSAQYYFTKIQPTYIPLDTIQLESDPNKAPVYGFTAAPPECVDCRTIGTHVKPSYWP